MTCKECGYYKNNVCTNVATIMYGKVINEPELSGCSTTNAGITPYKPEDFQDYYDLVSKPSHYTEGRKYEPKDVIRDWDLNFNLGNTVKYVARAGRKDDILQDLKKARQYLDFEIEYLEAQRNG